MNRYRAEIHGRLIEARGGSFSSQEVLVDGRAVERGWLDMLTDRPFRFEITGDDGRTHAVEVLWTSKRKSLGLKQQVCISVDGVERARLDPLPDHAAPGLCVNCGYALSGLAAENGEIRCPECGRHTSARTAGLA
jgi:hypothetical protein